MPCEFQGFHRSDWRSQLEQSASVRLVRVRLAGKRGRQALRKTGVRPNPPAVVVSVNWSGILQLGTALTTNEKILVAERPNDWALVGWRKRIHHLSCAIHVLWGARESQVLVVCNASIEIIVIGALRWLIAPD